MSVELTGGSRNTEKYANYMRRLCSFLLDNTDSSTVVSLRSCLI